MKKIPKRLSAVIGVLLLIVAALVFIRSEKLEDFYSVEESALVPKVTVVLDAGQAVILTSTNETEFGTYQTTGTSYTFHSALVDREYELRQYFCRIEIGEADSEDMLVAHRQWWRVAEFWPF
jgi:hypothetical protein